MLVGLLLDRKDKSGINVIIILLHVSTTGRSCRRAPGVPVREALGTNGRWSRDSACACLMETHNNFLACGGGTPDRNGGLPLQHGVVAKQGGGKKRRSPPRRRGDTDVQERRRRCEAR